MNREEIEDGETEVEKIKTEGARTGDKGGQIKRCN